jgi:hypothetical protein
VIRVLRDDQGAALGPYRQGIGILGYDDVAYLFSLIHRHCPGYRIGYEYIAVKGLSPKPWLAGGGVSLICSNPLWRLQFRYVQCPLTQS